MARKKPKLRITLTSSPIGECPNARRTLAALGLRRIRQSVIQPANDSVLGMLRVVEHLVTVEKA
jgi:large subunit ribosomal protein L30